MEDTVSLMVADGFVIISGTPEGFQKNKEKAPESTRKWRFREDIRNTRRIAEKYKKAPESTRKWRVKVNVKHCAANVGNEDKLYPANFEWKWGEDELLIVDQ